MRRLFLIVAIAAALLSLPGRAQTYVAQTAGTVTCNGGSHTAITPASWSALGTSPAVTYICGTITCANNTTTAFAFQSSGTSGSPLQLNFDTGAVLTCPAWVGSSSPGQGGAINTNGQSYITINGGPTCGWSSATLAVTACNGSIVNTANGTGLTYAINTAGIGILGATAHLLIENIDCHNMYQYTAGSGDNDGNYTGQNCVSIDYTNHAQTDITIKNFIFHDAGWLINSGYDGITIGPGGEMYNADHDTANAAVHAYIFNNHMHGWKLWDNGSNFHHDGDHCYATSAGASTVQYVYNNQYDDDGSVTGMNAYVFMEGNGSGTSCFVNSATGGAYIFNNVGVGSGLTAADIYVIGNGSGSNTNNIANLLFANNTMIGNQPTDTGANGAMAFAQANNFQYYNNAVGGLPPLIAQKSNFVNYLANPDYNFWENASVSGAAAYQANGVSSGSFATWQARGNDAHGGALLTSTTYFGLNSACVSGSLAANCAPVVGSPLIAAGKNLTSICSGQPNPGLGALCFDIQGNARPSTGAWDVGAYNYSSTPTIASFTVGATPGNTVPLYGGGGAHPSTDYAWEPRNQNYGGTGQPARAVNTPLVNLMSAWTPWGRPWYWRTECDPCNPYLWTLYNKPIGVAITGNSTSGVSWQGNNNGTVTLYLPNADIFTPVTTPSVGNAAPAPTNGSSPPSTTGAWASVYVTGFNSANAKTAGLNNPSTPAAYVAPYTIASSTATSITINVPFNTSLSGTETGYLTPQPQYYPNVPAYSTGTLFPPVQAIADTNATLAAALPAFVFSEADDLYSPQECNGHFFGAMQGDGTNAGNTVPTPKCYAPDSIPQWVGAFSTAGASAQLYRIEHGNEPDNYPSQGLPNFAAARSSNYGWTGSQLTGVAISQLNPGSGQMDGTYTSGTGGTCTDGANINVTISGGVCTATSVNAGGTVTWGSGPPACTVSHGGTPCTILTQAEGLANDYYDQQAELVADGVTQPAPGLDTAAATNVYNGPLLGALGTIIGTPPVVPNIVQFATPVTGFEPWGDEGDHTYPYGASGVCPNYQIASISRAGSTFPATSATTVTTTLPTNFQTPITGVSATYSSSFPGLLAVTIPNADTITSYSFVNGVAGINSVGTLLLAAAPTLAVGNYINVSGSGVDSTTAAQKTNLYITAESTSPNSYTVSGGPFFSDSQSATCSSLTPNCFDQLTVLSGSTVTTTGISGGFGFNLTGAHVQQSCAPGVTNCVTAVNAQPYVVSVTTSTGSPSVGTGTGGTLVMTAMNTVNVTDTPAQADGWNLDLQPEPGCIDPGTGNQYEYPPYNVSGNQFPFCGTSAGYGSGNFNEVGVPSTITFSTPTTGVIAAQQGPADSASSGLLTFVTATVPSPYTTFTQLAKFPSCNPPDQLTSPLAAEVGAQLKMAHFIESGFMQVGSGSTCGGGSGCGGLAAPIGSRISETNFHSPAQPGINNTIQQALAWIRHAATDLTANGYNGTLGSTGHTGTGSTYPWSGLTGENPFTGQSTSYSDWTFKTSPPTVGGVVTNYLQDVTTQTAPAVSAFFYGSLVFSDWLGTGCTGVNTPPSLGCTQATAFLNMSGIAPCGGLSVGAGSNIPGICGWPLIDGATGHTRVLLLNESEAASGNVVIDGTAGGLTTGTESLYTINAPTPALTVQATLTGYSGTTASFSVPCAAVAGFTGTAYNVNFNEPLLLSAIGGSTLNPWLYGQTAYVLTHTLPAGTPAAPTCTSGTEPFTATIPGGNASNLGEAVTASVVCPAATTAPWTCTWGETYKGQTRDATFDGNTLGTLSTPTVTAAGNVFTVPMAPMTAMVLDLSNGAASPAAPPTFSPVAGTYSGTQTVTASTSTSGCGSYIYFDTNPTPVTNQTTLSVAASETVYAYVHGCPGWSDSSIASAAYTITGSTTSTTMILSGTVIKSGTTIH
jgi:hypothetical protein